MQKIAMIEITYEVAKKLSELDDGVTLYGIDRRNGTEWELETEEDFDSIDINPNLGYGIEGAIFGEPYAEIE